MRQLLGGLLLCLAAMAGCSREPPVLTLALGVDAEPVGPIVKGFSSQTGITVEIVPVPAQGTAVDFDVLWDRDVHAGFRLAALGQLARIHSKHLRERPAALVDPDGYWAAVSGRARVLAYDPELVDPEQAPTRVLQLAEPDWARRLVLADPASGSAAWHAAALFAALGDDGAVDFYRTLKGRGARVVADEGAALAAVAAGERPLALVDSDAASRALDSGQRLSIVVPDQDGMGAVLLPTFLFITARGAQGEAGTRLVDHLLSPAVALLLAVLADHIVLQLASEVPGGILSVRQLRTARMSYADLDRTMPDVQRALAAGLFGKASQ